MLAYYGSRLSENMAETPEGFLICRNVPIARTGFQSYLPREIGREGEEALRVFRAEREVFSPQTLASFEGKPVSLGHPPEDIAPQNASAYVRGHVQNVRRGEGDEADLILADLFLTDPELIRRVKEGLREVSCGYDCLYADGPGGVEQRAIRGNHVAVVENGRAGSRVAIRDGQRPAPKERSKGTVAQKRKRLIGKLFGVAARDADPDEFAELVEELAPAAASGKTPAACEEEDETPSVTERLLAALERLVALSEARARENPLDALEQALSHPENSAAQVLSSEAESANEEETPPSPDAAEPVRAAISAIKPLIASLPEEQRAQAADRAARALRRACGMRDGASGVYAAINNGRAASALGREPGGAELGKRIMSARNPHYGASVKADD